MPPWDLECTGPLATISQLELRCVALRPVPIIYMPGFGKFWLFICTVKYSSPSFDVYMLRPYSL